MRKSLFVAAVIVAVATPAFADEVGVRAGPVGAGVTVGETHARDRDRMIPRSSPGINSAGRRSIVDLAPLYLIRGSSSQTWNGGGEGSCHSSVVAPSPQGLSPTTRLRLNASKSP